jgi:hypothetical protein
MTVLGTRGKRQSNTCLYRVKPLVNLVSLLEITEMDASNVTKNEKKENLLYMRLSVHSSSDAYPHEDQLVTLPRVQI